MDSTLPAVIETNPFALPADLVEAARDFARARTPSAPSTAMRAGGLNLKHGRPAMASSLSLPPQRRLPCG